MCNNKTKIFYSFIIIFTFHYLLTAQCAYTTFRYEPDYDGCGIRFIDKSEGSGTRTWDFGNYVIDSSIKK